MTRTTTPVPLPITGDPAPAASLVISATVARVLGVVGTDRCVTASPFTKQ